MIGPEVTTKPELSTVAIFPGRASSTMRMSTIEFRTNLPKQEVFICFHLYIGDYITHLNGDSNKPL